MLTLKTYIPVSELNLDITEYHPINVCQMLTCAPGIKPVQQ